jgi:tetratricopeptide (TPR) repeat protein
MVCLGVANPLSLVPDASGGLTAWAAPGSGERRNRIFSSRRRARFWIKRCQRDKARALTRAHSLETIRRAPISVFAAMAGSPLYGLSLQSDKRLGKLLGAARKVPKGVRRRERLGELSYARAIYHQRTARRARDRMGRAKVLGKGWPKPLVARRNRELALARVWLEKALRHYRSIVAMGHGSLKRQAMPLFRVASLSMELATHPANRRLVKKRLQYAKLVLASLSGLVRHHPRSKYIELALLAKGAMYYHLGQYGEAIGVLRQVRKWYSRQAPYAMYLLGWSLYKAGQSSKARVHLRAATRSRRSSKTLVRIARQDLVLVTSHLAHPGRAYKYFRSTVKGRDKRAAQRMFRRLARVFLARGQRAPAVRLYRSFLVRWPKSKDACVWMRTLQGLVKGSRVKRSR